MLRLGGMALVKIYRKTTTIKVEQFDGSQKYIFGHKVISDNSLVDALTHDPVYYSILINEDDPEEEPDELVFEIGDWIIKDGEDIHAIDDDTFKSEYDELPVIPKAVADWIKECKHKHISIGDMLCSERRPEKMRDWMALTPGTYQFDYARYQKYQELVARAWLDGYQLEAQHDTRKIEYRNYVMQGMASYGGDVAQALVWCGNHFTKLSNSQRNMINKLSVKERNQVIHELTMG